ncbi:MAG TPA: Gfo/Idh/MocA family oxidoreductase [Terracidiphilus sp.]|nr:Gfo/Idh/MocA family oxidoreductase [Terracidiphilus sp.]
MSLKIAIIGCGKIADAHVEEIRKISSASLVAVCDLEPIMAEQLATRYSVPHWYSDFSRMLDEQQPDVLHITTPPGSHLALVRQALAAGCHVFLEKPVAPQSADVRAILDAAETANRRLTVNYWPNFEEHALALRGLVAKGALGDIVHLESFYGYDLAGEYGTALRRDPNHWVRRLPGQLFQNVLDHALNKIVPYFTGDTPQVQVLAYQAGSGTNMQGGELLDELRVMMRDGDISAYVTFSAHARPVGHHLRVYGTRNTATADFQMRTVTLDRKQGFPSALGRLVPPFKVAKDYFRQGLGNVNHFAHARFHYFHGMHRLLAEFYRSIEENSEPPIPYAEILRVSELMDAIFQQVYPVVTA